MRSVLGLCHSPIKAESFSSEAGQKVLLFLNQPFLRLSYLVKGLIVLWSDKPYLMAMGNQIEGKDVAIIAHLTVVGLVIAIIINSGNKTAFGTFHIRQALGLYLTYLVYGFFWFIFLLIPVIGWLAGAALGLALLIMWVVGLINALNGYEKPMPIFGKNYAQWFSSVG